MMASKKAKPSVARPYTTDYGATKGHCETPKGAVMAALRYMRINGRKHTVIEQPNGPPIDIWWSGFFGVIVKVRSSKTNVVKLKRVT
jgi:hypothetical protein